MPRLPVISGRQAVAAFQRAGFEVKRQRGSHIRKAGLTIDQFEQLLRQ